MKVDVNFSETETHFPVKYSDQTATQEKTVYISEAGIKEIFPDSGFLLKKVTVNNDTADMTQEKTVSIAENGTTEVLPDAGKVLSKVSINTHVISEKLSQIADRTIEEIEEEDFSLATKIGNFAFYDCRYLRTVILGDKIKSIGNSSFRGCASLSSITMQEGVTLIDGNSFMGCNSLTEMTIPSTVTRIGAASVGIGSTTNKATIRILSTEPANINTSTFDTSKLEKIIVPAGTGEAYKAATNWSVFADYIEEAA